METREYALPLASLQTSEMLEHGVFMLKRYTIPRVQSCYVPTTAILGREGQREIKFRNKVCIFG